MNGNPPQKWQDIGTQTKVSIGVIVLLIAGFGTMFKGISDSKSEIVSAKNELATTAMQTKNELSTQIGTLSTRITSLEAAKNSWTSTDMFRWAVHLQQSNSDPVKLQKEGLKVPEPELSQRP